MFKNIKHNARGSHGKSQVGDTTNPNPIQGSIWMELNYLNLNIRADNTSLLRGNQKNSTWRPLCPRLFCIRGPSEDRLHLPSLSRIYLQGPAICISYHFMISLNISSLLIMDASNSITVDGCCQAEVERTQKACENLRQNKSTNPKQLQYLTIPNSKHPCQAGIPRLLQGMPPALAVWQNFTMKVSLVRRDTFELAQGQFEKNK